MSFYNARTVHDPTAMRALAHPIRLRIRELLEELGPMTATQLAERLGESPANCSFHLRTLAKYGFVEEAEGGKGRARPWRPVSQGWRIDPQELSGDAKRAATALEDAMLTADLRRRQRWHAEREGYPRAWRDAAFSMELKGIRLTAEELDQVGRQLHDLIMPYAGREEVPADALPVRFGLTAFPIGAPPDAEGTD